MSMMKISAKMPMSQAQIAQLFAGDQSIVSRHISSILEKRELEELANMHFLHIARSIKGPIWLKTGMRWPATRYVRSAGSRLLEYRNFTTILFLFSIYLLFYRDGP